MWVVFSGPSAGVGGGGGKGGKEGGGGEVTPQGAAPSRFRSILRSVSGPVKVRNQIFFPLESAPEVAQKLPRSCPEVAQKLTRSDPQLAPLNVPSPTCHSDFLALCPRKRAG